VLKRIGLWMAKDHPDMERAEKIMGVLKDVETELKGETKYPGKPVYELRKHRINLVYELNGLNFKIT
jgi:hypothetical protein